LTIEIHSKLTSTIIPFKLTKEDFNLIAMAVCLTLFLSSAKASGQFVSSRSSDVARQWGKMSLSNSSSVRELPSMSVLRLPNPDTTKQSGGGNLNLFGNFGNNILDSFKGKNIYLHLTAIASTALLVTTDVDYNVEHYFNQHEEYGNWARPILYTGMYLPFVAGGGLFAYAKIKNDNEALGASFAILQASLIEFMYNSTLKAITGRPGPDWRHNEDMKSLSKTFRFGFLRGGIYWGWPSGHTSTTMAVVSALTNYYPNATWLKIAGYSWVAYTMFGVSSVGRGGMHWLSDAVAGALMSYAVGSTVGKYYRKVYNSQTSTGANQAGNYLNQESIPLGTISIQF